MPLRDPTPDELKELGVAMATPVQQPSIPVAQTNPVDEALKSSQEYSANTPFWKQTLNTAGSILFSSNPNYIGNTMPAANRRLYEGVMLPTIAAAPFTGPFAPALASGAGAAASEISDYFKSVPEDRPTLTGAATRVGLQTAVPLATSGIATGLNAAFSKAPLPPSPLPVSPPVSAAAKAEFGSGLKQGVDTALAQKTVERELKEGLLQETAHLAPRVRVMELIKQLRNAPAAFARNEFDDLTKELTRLAKRGNGFMSITELEETLRAAGKEAVDSGDANAMKAYRFLKSRINQEIIDNVTQHLGPDAATKVKDLTSYIAGHMDVAEEAASYLTKDPVTIFRRVANNPEAAQVLEAFDHLNGTDYLAQVKALEAQASEFAAAKAAAASGNAVAKAAYQQALRAHEAAQTRAKVLAGALMGIPAAALGLGKFNLLTALIGMSVGGGLGAVGVKPVAGVAHGLDIAAPAATAALAQTERATEIPKK